MSVLGVLAASAANAQSGQGGGCWTDVVLFLDKSASMFPRQGSEPAALVFEGLERLLTDTERLLGSRIDLIVRPFGSIVDTPTKGPISINVSSASTVRAQLHDLLEDLRTHAYQNAPGALRTDFVAVVKALSSFRADHPSGANRRVFILASDFRHDREGSTNSGKLITPEEYWQKYGLLQTSLCSSAAPLGQSAHQDSYVLLSGVGPGRTQPDQEVDVLHELSLCFGERGLVSSLRSSNAGIQLATDLGPMLKPIRIAVDQGVENSPYTFRLTNTWCQPAIVSRLEFTANVLPTGDHSHAVAPPQLVQSAAEAPIVLPLIADGTASSTHRSPRDNALQQVHVTAWGYLGAQGQERELSASTPFTFGDYFSITYASGEIKDGAFEVRIDAETNLLAPNHQNDWKVGHTDSAVRNQSAASSNSDWVRPSIDTFQEAQSVRLTAQLHNLFKSQWNRRGYCEQWLPMNFLAVAEGSVESTSGTRQVPLVLVGSPGDPETDPVRELWKIVGFAVVIALILGLIARLAAGNLSLDSMEAQIGILTLAGGMAFTIYRYGTQRGVDVGKSLDEYVAIFCAGAALLLLGFWLIALGPALLSTTTPTSLRPPLRCKRNRTRAGRWQWLLGPWQRLVEWPYKPRPTLRGFVETLILITGASFLGWLAFQAWQHPPDPVKCVYEYSPSIVSR